MFAWVLLFVPENFIQKLRLFDCFTIRIVAWDKYSSFVAPGYSYERNPSFFFNVSADIGHHTIHKPDTEYDRELQPLVLVNRHQWHAFFVISRMIPERISIIEKCWYVFVLRCCNLQFVQICDQIVIWTWNIIFWYPAVIIQCLPQQYNHLSLFRSYYILHKWVNQFDEIAEIMLQVRNCTTGWLFNASCKWLWFSCCAYS